MTKVLGRNLTVWRRLADGRRAGEAGRASHQDEMPGNLSGGPVVENPCFHCRGHGFDDPWSGELGSRMPRGVAKNKRKDKMPAGQTNWLSLGWLWN